MKKNRKLKKNMKLIVNYYNFHINQIIILLIISSIFQIKYLKNTILIKQSK